jgi:uncharacterized membrane protein
MFIVVAFALMGLVLGEPFFESPLIGLSFGIFAAMVYNAMQRIALLEVKLKDQEEIIENLLDTQATFANEKSSTDTIFDELPQEEVIADPVQSYSSNEETRQTIPINDIEAVMASLDKIDEVEREQKKGSSLDLWASLKRIFIGENPLVRIGGVILFLGLSFFAKFLIDQSIITLQMRLIFLGFIGIGMMVLGWRWREKEGDYGLILQAIGIAIVYLDIFSCAKLYGLIDLKIAFIFMLMMVLIASWLSIIQKSLPLILFSITGGFLVPILTSDGTGSHVMLFSYYALLNLAIVIIAYFHSWRILNLVGFVFTFIIATSWGVLRYEEEFFVTTEPFLILFFLFYLTINVLFTKHLKKLRIKYVDTAITFGLPFITFALQDAMIGYDDDIMGFSALVLSLIYGLLSYRLYFNRYTKDLSYSFFSLAIIFITIAIGYQFEYEMLSIIWAVEAVGTVWISLKQDRLFTRVIALVVMLFSLLVTIENIASQESTILFSVAFLSALFVFLLLFTLLWLYHYYQEQLREFEVAMVPFMLGFGLFIYQFIGFMQFDIYDVDRRIDYFLIYTSVVSLILMWVAKASHWSRLKGYLSSFFIVGTLFIVFSQRLGEPSPFYDMGIVAFPLFFTVYHLLAYYLEEEWENADIWQILWAILLVITLSFEFYYQAQALSRLYQDIAWGIAALGAFGVVYLGSKTLKYPFQKHLEAYNFYFLGVMSIYITLWSMILFTHVTSSYLPLVNLLDALAIAVVFSLYYYIHSSLDQKELPFILLGLYGLVFISVILARSMHALGGVEYSEAILHNMSYQMGLSIVWSVVAFILMILSQKLQSRGVWIASMSLIGITVCKLLFIDMSNSATIERIISFIGAGLLILIIGYFFKIPSKEGTLE